jgi:hypothetical protein
MGQAVCLAITCRQHQRTAGLPSPARCDSSADVAAFDCRVVLQGIKPLGIGVHVQPDMEVPDASQQTTGEQQAQPPSQPYDEHSTAPSPHGMPPGPCIEDGNELMTFRQELVGGA